MSRWLFFPSTGPSLIIHDAFGGSGTVSGRTPDTVNNGNNWVSIGAAMRVLSGYMTMNSAPAGSERSVVNPNATEFKIITQTQKLAATNVNHGVVVHNTGAGSTSTNLYLYFNQLYRYEVAPSTGGTATLLGTWGYPSTNVLDWEVEMNGTSMTYLIKDGATTMYSGTTTNLNSANSAGYYQNVQATNHTYCLDFKVYA